MGWYDDLLAGRNPFGTVGFSIGDALSPWTANNALALDPRLQNLGYSTNVSHQEGDVYSLNAPEGLDQQGYIMQDGTPMVQVSSQAAGLVRDPSQVRYDPRYGMLTSRENYNLQDSPIDRLVGGAIRAGTIALPAMFMGGMIPGVEGIFGPGATPDMFGPGGGLSPEEAIMGGGQNAAGASSYPLMQNVSLPDMSGWNISAPGGGGSSLISQLLGGDMSGAAGTVGTWLSDPLNLGRLGLMGASLLGGGGQQPSGGAYTPWSGTPYDFSGGSSPAGGSANPYTAAQLAAHQAEDAMGYYGYPQMRSSYGPYPSGGVGQLMGYGGGRQGYGGDYMGGGRQGYGGDYMGGGINPSANGGGWGASSMRSALGSGYSGAVPRGFDAWGGTPDQGSESLRPMPYFQNGGFNPGAGGGSPSMSKPFSVGYQPPQSPGQGWNPGQMIGQGLGDGFGPQAPQEGMFDPIAEMRGRTSQTDQNAALQEASRLRMLQGIQGGGNYSLQDMANARWGSGDLVGAIGGFRSGQQAPVDLTGEQAQMLRDAGMQRTNAFTQRYNQNLPAIMAMLGRAQ